MTAIDPWALLRTANAVLAVTVAVLFIIHWRHSDRLDTGDRMFRLGVIALLVANAWAGIEQALTGSPGGLRTCLIFAALFWLTIAAAAATKTDIDNHRRKK